MLEPILNAELQRELDDLRVRLEAELSLLDQTILQRYPVHSYVEALDGVAHGPGYHFVPDAVRTVCIELERAGGQRTVEIYHRLVLTELLQHCESRRHCHAIAASVLPLLRQEFQRMVAELSTGRDGFYLHKNDLFLKDLGLCRMKLLPCGSELVDVASGVPRSTLLRGGVRQLFACSLLVARRLGRFKPLYEAHWDRRLARQFTKHDYDLCYLRIADLLECNPRVKGMYSASWWFDPILQDISPELGFLSRVPVENGARIFRVGPDAHAKRDAISFSATRKALYTSGRYLPTRYVLIWPRTDLLAWAAERRAKEAAVRADRSTH